MSQETTSRRDRVVMALGLCALLLFAANLLTLVRQHFFGDHEGPRHVIVHEIPTPAEPPVPPVIVTAPRAAYHFRVTTGHEVRTEALLAMKERLLEEAGRLTDEASRLAEAGHMDASVSLQETVEATLDQLHKLEHRIDQLPDEALILSAPHVDVQVDVADPSTS